MNTCTQHAHKYPPTNAHTRMDFAPGPVVGETKLPSDLEDSEEPFVPLDSVGGCTTLVRADVHREGALFSPHYVVRAQTRGRLIGTTLAICSNICMVVWGTGIIRILQGSAYTCFGAAWMRCLQLSVCSESASATTANVWPR
jgi:hypothetical protein